MKFLRTDGKLYALVCLIGRVMLLNVIVVLGTVSMLGLCYALQICRVILSNGSVLEFLRKTTLAEVFKSIYLSIISLLVFFLGALNMGLLPQQFLRFAYMFLYLCIAYIVVCINLFSSDLFLHKIKLSHVISVCLIQYPKFVFFFSLLTGTVFLTITGAWLFASVVLYLGSVIYLAHRCANPTLTEIMEQSSS